MSREVKEGGVGMMRRERKGSDDESGAGFNVIRGVGREGGGFWGVGAYPGGVGRCDWGERCG